MIKIKPMDRQNAFNTGYLYFISGLNSEGDGESKILFSKLKESGLGSASGYYLGLLEKDAEKESCFNKSLGAFKGNVESLNEIANIKLRKNLPSDAYTLSESIREINPQSFYINKLKARALVSRGWYYDALKESHAPKNLIKSAGYEIEGEIYLKIKKYKEALNAYKKLYETDKYNTDYLNNLLECYDKTGKYDEAIGLLNQCAEYYPNNAMLRLKHAKLIENTKGPGAALPYLLYARKISPYHKDVLLQTGLVYHKMDKEELALQYLNAALRFDPKNKWIAGYIEYLKHHRPKPRSGANGPPACTRYYGFLPVARRGLEKQDPLSPMGKLRTGV